MAENFYNKYTWSFLLNENPPCKYSVKEYHKILSDDVPDFLEKYLNIPLLSRLKGIGLLCGTDWTKLYKNRFFYSRYDHSLGVALIIWHFTHDKTQTLAGLFHDVSTPLFSHVADFSKGDALTQSSTEETNKEIILRDNELRKILLEDKIQSEEICDYHKIPVADNEIPALSADRLEYMFPSGMALNGSWTLDEIKQTYNDISILKNENGIDELGFNTIENAELYFNKFCMIGHMLQLNENKLTLSLLAKITDLAISENIISEDDCMKLSEKEAFEKFEKGGSEYFQSLLKTFRNMESIEHTTTAPQSDDYFYINLSVKQRYINPLVKTETGSKRLSKISALAASRINDFLSYKDTPFGAVKIQPSKIK